MVPLLFEQLALVTNAFVFISQGGKTVIEITCAVFSIAGAGQ